MTRRVVLVCGPPCGGKSTYVAEHAEPGDIVLDQDVIARELGSRRDWLHSGPVAKRAQLVMRHRIDDVARMHSGTAWVIRTMASAIRRRRLAQRLHADEVIVVAPPQSVVLARAAERPSPQRTASLVRGWYTSSAFNPEDTVVTDQPPP